MTLSEELLLLAPDGSLAPGGTPVPDHGIAGALLLDLAAEGLVVVKGKTLVGIAGTASHPLQSAALTELLASDEPHAAQHWLTQLPATLAPLRTQVGTSLAGRGVLTDARRAALGLDTGTASPDVDPAPEHELRARLHRVLVYGGEPDTHTALLISLLRTLGMGRSIVDKHHRKQADARAKAITQETSDGTTAPASLSHVVHAVLAAMIAAATLTTTT